MIGRRRFLSGAGSGLGSVALNAMLQGDGLAGGVADFRPKAKSVIWLFMRGGVSHLESFDRKPEIDRESNSSRRPQEQR